MNSPNAAELLALQTASHRALSLFGSTDTFAETMKMAEVMSQSTLVPEQYRGNPANCLIAIEISTKLGVPFISVAQNLSFFDNRPGWSGKYVLAQLNSCGRYDRIQFEFSGQDAGPGVSRSMDFKCRAYTTLRGTDIRVEGIWVSWGMVVENGWAAYEGSPWLTMADLMFRYRAAAFFGNIEASDLLLGIPTVEEVRDGTLSSKPTIQKSNSPRPKTGEQVAPSDNLVSSLLKADLPPPPVRKPAPAVVQDVKANTPMQSQDMGEGVDNTGTAAAQEEFFSEEELAEVPAAASTVPEKAQSSPLPSPVTATAAATAKPAKSQPKATQAPPPAPVAQVSTIDASVITELCHRAKTVVHVLAAANRLQEVNAASRAQAESEVLEAALEFLCKESTRDGMATLMKVYSTLTIKENAKIFHSAYNGRAKAISGKA